MSRRLVEEWVMRGTAILLGSAVVLALGVALGLLLNEVL